MQQKEIYALVAKGARMVQAHYQKTSQYYISSTNYIPFFEQMKIKQLDHEIITSISLECTGHGSFTPHKVAARFLENLQQLTHYNSDIKRIKIKLSGFDLSKQIDAKFTTRSKKANRQKLPTLIEGLTKLLDDKLQKLTSLEIRVSNVRNCTFEDFKAIMALGVNRQARELVNLSCEFSDWSFPRLIKDSVGAGIYEQNKEIFKKVDHDRNGQPNLQKFMNMLQQSFEGTVTEPLPVLRKFRLEISTWYYTDFEVEKFFHNVQLKNVDQLPKQDKIPKRIQYFHNEFRIKVEQLIKDLMPDLTNMQIDLRNWNKKFEMGVLKSAILNCSNERRNSLSQISKQISNDQKKIITNVLSHVQKSMMIGKSGVNNKQKMGEEKKQQQDEKEKFFDLLVVI